MTRSMNPSKGPPLPAGGDGPALGGPEGVESGHSRFVGAAGLYDAEEVLDPVHLIRAEEGVALDIEEQVPLRRFGQHQQAVIEDQISVPVPGRIEGVPRSPCRPARPPPGYWPGHGSSPSASLPTPSGRSFRVSRGSARADLVVTPTP